MTTQSPPMANETNAAAVAEALECARGVNELLAGLDRDFVGLEPVKTRIRQIAALLVVDRMRRAAGLDASRPTLHMAFRGNPGTGKTTVALRMADILHRLGLIEHNRIVAVSRDDLVGQYVGHTGPKTREVLKRALGGVLFIDEAYTLHRPENDRDYGAEAVEILLQVMEAERDRLVVVFAGYGDRMDALFRLNPGLSSRVAHHIDFPDYTVDELLVIAGRMLHRDAYTLSPEAERAFGEYLQRRAAQPLFAHARSVRNALQRARLRHADRIQRAMLEGRVPTVPDLQRIDEEDIRRSRVFDEAAGGAPA